MQIGNARIHVNPLCCRVQGFGFRCLGKTSGNSSLFDSELPHDLHHVGNV